LILFLLLCVLLLGTLIHSIFFSRAGCVQRATQGERQDGGLEQLGEHLVDSGGPGALGRVTRGEARRGNGGRELDASERDGRVDLRGRGRAAKPVREDVRDDVFGMGRAR
jgi:hypothetical protein